MMKLFGCFGRKYRHVPEAGTSTHPLQDSPVVEPTSQPPADRDVLNHNDPAQSEQAFPNGIRSTPCDKAKNYTTPINNDSLLLEKLQARSKHASPRQTPNGIHCVQAGSALADAATYHTSPMTQASSTFDVLSLSTELSELLRPEDLKGLQAVRRVFEARKVHFY